MRAEGRQAKTHWPSSIATALRTTPEVAFTIHMPLRPGASSKSDSQETSSLGAAELRGELLLELLPSSLGLLARWAASGTLISGRHSMSNWPKPRSSGTCGNLPDFTKPLYNTRLWQRNWPTISRRPYSCTWLCTHQTVMSLCCAVRTRNTKLFSPRQNGAFQTTQREFASIARGQARTHHQTTAKQWQNISIGQGLAVMRKQKISHRILSPQLLNTRWQPKTPMCIHGATRITSK